MKPNFIRINNNQDQGQDNRKFIYAKKKFLKA